MVKMMKELVRIHVASSQLISALDPAVCMPGSKHAFTVPAILPSGSVLEVASGAAVKVSRPAELPGSPLSGTAMSALACTGPSDHFVISCIPSGRILFTMYFRVEGGGWMPGTQGGGGWGCVFLLSREDLNSASLRLESELFLLIATT